MELPSHARAAVSKTSSRLTAHYPIKSGFAVGAAVRDNPPNAFFVANLDTYGGNSGSPVFNSDTHEVEGILVRGEDCTRTTEFAHLVSDRL
ncbi:S46 family peptidase (plasmid) [Paenibacillus polymyxa]|uniref:S46 family peptidase n=1 Tax=Paenibacillus polymyxa TaxID=1406 RepID=UPI003B5A0781